MKLTLANLVCATALLLSGCAQFIPSAALQQPPTIRAASPDVVENLPPPRENTSGPVVAAPPNSAKVIPISLDTVFRLGNNQNGEITLAREKLEEAYARHDLARKAWLPDVYVGSSYFRHEGGIQDFNGQFIRSSYGAWLTGMEICSRLDLFDAAFQKVIAERRVWQQRGELSKISSETLLEVSTTYIDWLTAIEGQRVAEELEQKISQLFDRASQRSKIDKSFIIEVSRVNAEVKAQKIAIRKLREAAISAEAKIKHLLGIDPMAVLVPVDHGLLPIRLVDATAPPEQLIDRAWSRGPGVAELTGLLDLVERSAAKSGAANLMPVVEFNMAEGLFGAGPGSSMDFDNRLDMCVRLRWNLKKCCVAEENRRIMDSQRLQVHQTYANLRSKLALGVQEARESSLSNDERLGYSSEQLELAENTYSLAKSRLESGIAGASYGEMLLTLRTLAAAQYSRIEALREFDRAQLRLFVLLGEAAHP